MKLSGNGALVAGGASGLGAATARMLVDQGARCVIMDRDANAAEALANELGENAFAVAGDICNCDDVHRAMDALGDIPLRLTVITAMTGSRQPVLFADGTASTVEDFQRVINVNLTGTFNVLRLSAEKMATLVPDENGARGLIVMTSSIAGLDGVSPQIAYTTAKAAVAAMTLPAARDLAPHGIRVMTIAPGSFDTPPLKNIDPATRSSLSAQPLFPKRLGIDTEYAAMLLAIVNNDYLNADTIRLDGGARLQAI